MQESRLVPIVILFISILITAATAQTCHYKTSKYGSPVIKSVTMQPGPIVDVGANVTLMCTASQPLYGGFDKKDSAVPSVIKLFHKGENLIHECRGSKETPKICQVLLRHVSLADGGDYSCQAKSNRGCTYVRYRLTVNVVVVLLPVFVEHPSNQTADVDDEVTLQCVVNGDQPYKLQWWKNNEKLSSKYGWSTSASHRDSTTMFRLGKNITDQDYGKYWCVAQSSAGTSYSRRAFLMPKQGSIEQATFNVEPRSRTVREGERVELLCAAFGFPRAVLRWQKNGSDIPSHATDLERLILRFEQVRTSDAGQYRCKATQFFGVVYSKEATLSVISLPVVEVKPQNQTVAIGMNASLTCSAEGTPIPTLTWIKILTPDSNKTVKVESGKESVLDLIGVTEENFGVYLCEATNIAGTTISHRAVVLAKQEFSPSRKSRDDTTDVQDLVFIIVPVGVLVVLITIVLIIGVRIYSRKRRTKKEAEEAIPLNDNIAKRLAHSHPTNQANSPGHTRSMLVTRNHVQEKGVRDQRPHARWEGCQPERMFDGRGSDISQDKSKPLSTAVYMNSLGVSMDWELDWKNLRILDEPLGQGEFGIVNKGLYRQRDGQDMQVAVKMLKDENCEDDRRDLMQELSTLKKVGRHDNIVCLVGACTRRPICVVLEFVAGGNLEDLLRASLEATLAKQKAYTNQLSDFSERQLLQFAADTACGMTHLEKHQVVHRDLAARNVLLNVNTMVAKVADFGLARDVSTSAHGKYIKRSNGRVPWKWTALEALRDGQSSSKSDVWSFGVFLWEVSTLGTEPYPGESNVVSLHSRLVKGYRMPRPPQCSHEIYELMCACWETVPDQRPSFQKIHHQITDMLRDEKRTYINVDHYRELLTEQGTAHVIQ